MVGTRTPVFFFLVHRHCFLTGIYREHLVEQGDSELVEMHMVEEIEANPVRTMSSNRGTDVRPTKCVCGLLHAPTNFSCIPTI